jgi:hypothetical protein
MKKAAFSVEALNVGNHYQVMLYGFPAGCMAEDVNMGGW